MAAASGEGGGMEGARRRTKTRQESSSERRASRSFRWQSRHRGQVARRDTDTRKGVARSRLHREKERRRGGGGEARRGAKRTGDGGNVDAGC